MPLIAADILEAKIRELIALLKQLETENAGLLSKLESKSAAPSVPPEAAYELEKTKEAIVKLKTERSVLHSKISAAIKKIDEISSPCKDNDDGE